MSILNLSINKAIYYELVSGKTDHPYLIFLHEGLGCTSMWKNFPEQLCRKTGCPGLLYDRIGYGQSSPLHAVRTIHYMHDYALNELPQVIKAVIPDRSFILIGHSDGGSISLIFGAERSPLLKGIVTEAAHVFVEPETIESIRASNDAFDHGKLEALFKYHGEKTAQIFKAWSETWLSEWFSHWNIEYLLPSVKCPMLVTQGREDQYGTEHQVNSIVSKSSGSTESYFIENCGHSPHLEQPERLMEKICGFIEEISKE